MAFVSIYKVKLNYVPIFGCTYSKQKEKIILVLNSNIRKKAGFQRDFPDKRTKASPNHCINDWGFLVRATGLEPAHLATQEPKSCMSANFITPAYITPTHKND